jgi:hypothetical protein
MEVFLDREYHVTGDLIDLEWLPGRGVPMLVVPGGRTKWLAVERLPERNSPQEVTAVKLFFHLPGDDEMEPSWICRCGREYFPHWSLEIDVEPAKLDP